MIPIPTFRLEQQAICEALRVVCHDGTAQQALDTFFGLVVHTQREHRIVVVFTSFRGGKHFRQTIRAGQISRRNHRRAGKPVHIHVAERDDAIEPTVRITLHHMLATLLTITGLFDLALQKSEGTWVVNLGVGVRSQRGIESRSYRIHELAARIRCECLKFRRVHSRIFFPFSIAAISSRR